MYNFDLMACTHFKQNFKELSNGQASEAVASSSAKCVLMNIEEVSLTSQRNERMAKASRATWNSGRRLGAPGLSASSK